MKTILALGLSLLGGVFGASAACVEITCPPDIVTGCKSPSGAAVDFAPIANTTCGTSITVACIPPSGSTFAIGTNVVQCVVQDPRGNIARCDFRVIVTNTPPVIQCPSDIVTACQSPLGATVNFSPTATGGCDVPVNVVCNPPSGSVFPIGTNSVGCVATDGFGRMDRCSFRVIVTNGPPTIICPPPLTIPANATCRGVLPVIAVTVLERCTPSNQLVFAQSPPAGTLLSVGDHTVTVWVSEGNHLDASCTVVVHVVDVTPPVIKCPGTVTAHCAPAGTNVYFKVDATDNCDGAVAVTCEPPSGSFFSPGSTLVKCSATDSAGNSSQCTFQVNVLATPPLLTYVGGSKDSYALPPDPTSKSACLISAMNGQGLANQFDQSFAGRWLGHSFENLPGGIEAATLRIRMKPKSLAASNDVLRIGLTDCAQGSAWIWSAPIRTLPGAGGVWGPNADGNFSLDLAAMPANPVALLPLLNLESTHRLDIAIGDDTVVDWIELNIRTCQASGVAGGVPYMLHKGSAARGGAGRIEFGPGEDRLFNVDLYLGKSEGIEIGFGDDWPGATNPPISDCSVPVNSLLGTTIDWKPNGEFLCTVKFMFDLNFDYTDVLLTQPTNIGGGRAIEVYSKGQMVSRYFVEDGNGPGGVVLPNDACMLSMGFGMGEFFMALKEPAPVSFAFAKHISGEQSPVMGDFIRLIFNIPMTAGGDGGVRFDPDIVVNIQGGKLDVRQINVRKFGGRLQTAGEDILSLGDDLAVLPYGEGGDPSKTCYEPPVKSGEWNETEAVWLALTDLLGADKIVPGAAFDLEASAEYGTTPPLTGVIGRLRCEVVSVNPLVTRFRANFSDQYLGTKLVIYRAGANSINLEADTIEMEGAPIHLSPYIVNNFPVFQIGFEGANGANVTVNGQTIANAKFIHFAPIDPPIGLHHAPYLFCVTPFQAWENIPITFYNPLSSPGRPASSADCVSVQGPSRVVRWSPEGKSVPVDFNVEARSACDRKVTVTCVPKSGSEFPVGVTFVACQAVDELGYAARCRFPVAVYESEPRLSIERVREGVAVTLPAEYVPAEYRPSELFPAIRPTESEGWELESVFELPGLRWENLGPGMPGERDSLRWVLPVGDPSRYYRLRAR